MQPQTQLLRTPLHNLHLELGARMVPFAGYDMPVQYPKGLMAEHLHTREAAGLFDVSHMGQLCLRGPQAAQALETLLPMDVLGLGEHRQRYGLLPNEEGGILDDLMFVNRVDEIFIIVNGACKHDDTAWLQKNIGDQCEIVSLPDQALLALQGPQAEQALIRLLPDVGALTFMRGAWQTWRNTHLYVTRSGYTGEDGFEISLPSSVAESFARELLEQPEVEPIGLGARNSLRLEAGMCLYGSDIDTKTSPVQADLSWAIQKVRRTDGERAGNFSGAKRILSELKNQNTIQHKRVALLGLERVPVREPAELLDENDRKIGKITSGLLSPCLNKPIALGYVDLKYADKGNVVHASVRGKKVPMQVVSSPFVPNRYKRA